jgi:hypothetical protein
VGGADVVGAEAGPPGFGGLAVDGPGDGKVGRGCAQGGLLIGKGAEVFQREACAVEGRGDAQRTLGDLFAGTAAGVETDGASPGADVFGVGDGDAAVAGDMPGAGLARLGAGANNLAIKRK